MYFQECVMYFQECYVFSLQDKMAVNSVFNKHLMIMISTLHNSTRSKTMTSKNSTRSNSTSVYISLFICHFSL